MHASLLHLLTPHHTNNHRPRLLHPAGLSVLVGLFVLLQSWMQLSQQYGLVHPGGFVLGYASSITSQETVALANERRLESGLSTLQWNESLSKAAVAKAQHMFEHDYWAHIAPDGTTPWKFIRSAGYSYSVAGENLARDFQDTDSMVQAWMDSPTHRDNIMNPKYSEIGIGVVDGVLDGMETTLVVQMFGAPVHAAAPQPAITAEATSQNPLDAEFASDQIAKIPAEPALPSVTADSQLHRRAVVAGDQTTQAVQIGNGIRVSPLVISRLFVVSITLLLLLVLVYDSIIVTQQRIPRQVGKNWAHLGFLGLVFVVVLAMSSGTIL